MSDAKKAKQMRLERDRLKDIRQLLNLHPEHDDPRDLKWALDGMKWVIARQKLGPDHRHHKLNKTQQREFKKVASALRCLQWALRKPELFDDHLAPMLYMYEGNPETGEFKRRITLEQHIAECIALLDDVAYQKLDKPKPSNPAKDWAALGALHLLKNRGMPLKRSKFCRLAALLYDPSAKPKQLYNAYSKARKRDQIRA